MRLIDADALLNAMDKRYKEKEESVPDNLAEGFMQMEKLIKEQPTAYDVEKVVEQIRSESQLMSETQLPHRYYKAIGSKRARAIIRKGGVNE